MQIFSITLNGKDDFEIDLLKSPIVDKEKGVDHLIAPIWGFSCAIDWFYRALLHMNQRKTSYKRIWLIDWMAD